MTPTLVQNIAANYANKPQRNMSRKLKKEKKLRTCKLCNSNIKASVFEDFVNWMLDHGNQQKYFKKHLTILAQLMTVPFKIDARKSNAKNIENNANMVPKWRSKSIKNV